ncbi:MAG TPA: class I SAM-dependent methyltransferase [Hyphomicrobiaceae bacterium]|nr:class I SAM-dependent methyltransferase [Hyphomicrobiaceae bacterium]
MTAAGLPARSVSAAPEREFSSFRDPAGELFWQAGAIYRGVNPCYERQFHSALNSGLLEGCVADGLLLPFEIVDAATARYVALLKPRQLSFISYPYEWSFDQLKDAAVLTLKLHLRALPHGMLLKDASAFNVQLVDGRPCLIDHLSFDLVSEHSAWPAYGQFCRHFLAPLALMAYVDLGLGRLLQTHIDGVPLDLAVRLLPRRAWLRPGLFLHLCLHARMVEKHAGSAKKVAARPLSAEAMTAIARSLLALVEKLSPRRQATEWGSYYADTNYSAAAFSAKERIVRELVQASAARTVWDIGANDGHFSRLIRDLADEIVSIDVDPRAVNSNYLRCRRNDIRNIVPLLADINSPTPALGFANRERRALCDRGRPDLILALALVHHLAISNNLPFRYIAEFLAGQCRSLVIEFVPKSDSQVQRLLLNRRDIFDDYTEEHFREAFSAAFSILERRAIAGSERSLYLMRSKSI